MLPGCVWQILLPIIFMQGDKGEYEPTNRRIKKAIAGGASADGIPYLKTGGNAGFNTDYRYVEDKWDRLCCKKYRRG
jgi:hypothetical protein